MVSQQSSNQSCISGQLVGGLNPATDPLGCPTNPIYTSNQTNTYTFTNPVAGFTIDFTGFNSTAGCARIEVKINGVFFPLTNANVLYFSHTTAPPCYSIPFNTLVTSDGYLTSSASGGLGTQILGGLIFRNLNATSVSVSTNDANGTLFSDPYNCSAPVQFCSGSWALQRPVTSNCFSGQWVGWQNPGPPPVGCPINPAYPGTETNTFTFTNPVSNFSIDFTGFDGSNECPRIGLKVNGSFYHLTSSNLAPLPLPECPSTYIMSVTPDGYLVSNSIGGKGQGRITINGVNAGSVDVSTNDGAGTIFSNPFNGNNVVPLKLESFLGTSNNCNTLLNWKTGTEQNVKNIEIQRSDDGNSFAKVGLVSPKGSNSHYSFIIRNSKDAYFRLKITDLDGYYEYSIVLSIKSNCRNITYQVIPNPANSSIQIIGLTNDDEIFILDILGRKVLSFHSSQGNNKFDIQKLPTGMYFLQVINGGIIKSNSKLFKD